MLSELERVLVAALHDEHPVERLRELVAASGRLTSDERDRLLAADADGLRVTSLILRKLRLERVIGGDAELAAACDADPVAFADAFRRYAAAVPPTAEFPADEARAFRRFVEGR